MVADVCVFAPVAVVAPGPFCRPGAACRPVVVIADTVSLELGTPASLNRAASWLSEVGAPPSGCAASSSIVLGLALVVLLDVVVPCAESVKEDCTFFEGVIPSLLSLSEREWRLARHRPARALTQQQVDKVCYQPAHEYTLN